MTETDNKIGTRTSSAIKSGGRWTAATLLLAMGATLIFVAGLKLASLWTWQYTSDLFIYDQVMQQTLAGHTGVEYTYGNQFGDHALLILLALLPAKALLGGQMVVALVLIGPLLHALAAAAVYLAARSCGACFAQGTIRPLLCAVVYFLPFGMLQGFHEVYYGCHVDVWAGPIATIFAALLICRRASVAAGRSNRRLTIGAVGALIALCLLKEEMALLATVLCATLLLAQPSRINATLAFVALTILAVGLASIHVSATEWNRGNASLLGDLVSRLRSGGIAELLMTVPWQRWWMLIAAYCGAMGLAVAVGGRIDPIAGALFITGLLKIGFSLLVWDPLLTMWHNFPGIVMLGGALALQFACAAPQVQRRRLAGVLLPVLVLSAGTSFVATELPFARDALRAARAARVPVKHRWAELRTLQSEIDRSRVVAISPLTAAAWTGGYRYAFFPRGVYQHPVGIAEYVVLDRDNAAEAQNLSEFDRITETRSFILMKRRGLDEAYAPARRRFIELFGADAIGGDRSLPPVDWRSDARDTVHRVNPAGTVTIEAEDWSRASVVVDRSVWGGGIGVIVEKPGVSACFVEYDFDAESTGNYTLDVRLAADQPRPITMRLNDDPPRDGVGAIATGGWRPENQTWTSVGAVTLRSGRNVLRFERAGPWPHIDKFRLVASTP